MFFHIGCAQFSHNFNLIAASTGPIGYSELTVAVFAGQILEHALDLRVDLIDSTGGLTARDPSPQFVEEQGFAVLIGHAS